MLYRLIDKKKEAWFSSNDCPARELITYITLRGKLRDAQIEAIKTFLFLKIAGENRPLWQLFSEGFFTSISIDELEVTSSTRKFLIENPAALALLEYSMLKDANGKSIALDLEKAIKGKGQEIDCVDVFKEMFYNVPYTDYLYSLPMGAGKTFLMAAFIYLELYFAINEPDNKAFAKNFIIFAPSGLKSSVVPSLKTIKNFDPTWVLPEPAASNLQRLLKFEVLDEQKSKNKSNRAKNPNTQKISAYQPLEELVGLVAVTNAEKVILDHVPTEDLQYKLYNATEDEKERLANELRAMIGRMPSLSIYIDEVHHTVSEDIKLRQVVTGWTAKETFNSVIGFSGTPYLEKAATLNIGDGLKLRNSDITNVVYYYPLINGINNFLKSPIVKTTTNTDHLAIVEQGVRDFFERFKDKVYANQSVAKLGIYCGTIENLETRVYPLVTNILSSLGLNPNEAILKYHRGNKDYKITPAIEAEFVSLDSPLSKIRVVLLVQIGKEGWDCKSLTGVILSQKGDCPTNMVLQTSCRCLRQVDRGAQEDALIWLNKFNEEKLDAQLKQQQNSSLQEFANSGKVVPTVVLDRYSRMEHLQLPPIDFFQLKVEYNTLATEEYINPTPKIQTATDGCEIADTITTKLSFDDTQESIAIEKKGLGASVSYSQWLYEICRESFGSLRIEQLLPYDKLLKDIYSKITIDGQENLSFDQAAVRSNIRKSFCAIRNINTTEEIISCKANLLHIENFAPQVEATIPNKYYPEQSRVKEIVNADNGVVNTPDAETLKAIEQLRSIGANEMAEQLAQKHTTNTPEKDSTYHYLPYRFDSNFEIKFFEEILKIEAFKSKGLEIYYNGDRAMTEFKIKCFKKQNSSSWKYIGKYTPDFLIIKRSGGEIHQAIIVETKGEGYAGDRNFIEKRDFMESFFCRENNDKFGYNRFEYLYLEDNLEERERVVQTIDMITTFFE